MLLLWTFLLVPLCVMAHVRNRGEFKNPLRLDIAKLKRSDMLSTKEMRCVPTICNAVKFHETTEGIAL